MFSNNNIDIKEFKNTLKNGISELMSSEKYKKFLDFCSNLYDYSANNQFLIYLQKPDSTCVGSYTFWKSQKRHVVKGEKGITIIAPNFKKFTEIKNITLPDGTAKKIEHEELKLISFRKVTVFDISQTQGEPIPKLVQELSGESDMSFKLKKILENISKIPIKAVDKLELNGANGCFRPKENEICYRNDLSMNHTVKTIIHEIVHSKIHNNYTDYTANRRACEIEAESAAYIICKHFGLDTSDYSFGYIASWSGGHSIENFETSLNISLSVSKEIIKEINNEFEIVHFKKNIAEELKDNLFYPNENLVNGIHKIYKEKNIKNLNELKSLDLNDENYCNIINELKTQEIMRNNQIILER